MATVRGYSAAKFMLELDGKDAGFLISVEGGEPVASVVSEPPGPGLVVRKHLGQVAYEPIQMSFSSGMSESLYKWMTEWLKGKQPTKSGAIVFLDYNFGEQRRLEFDKARITEVTFPALDGSSKDVVHFNVTLQPQSTVLRDTLSGAKKSVFANKGSKSLSAPYFKLNIGGLKTAKVGKVETLVVKQPVDRQLPLEVPDIVFTLPETEATGFFKWFDDFAIKNDREGAQNNELNGTLEYLSPNGTVLFTLTLSNLGIFRIHRERSEAGAEVISRVRIMLYCEEIGFNSASDAVGAAVSNSASAPPNTQPAVTNLVVTEALLTLLGDSIPKNARLTLAAATEGVRAEPQLIAQRLRATVQPAAPSVSSRPRRDDGEALGTRWASETATLDELEQIAALEPREWTAIKLTPAHSLITALITEGLVPAGADQGALELDRDSFVEGIVAGASKILRTTSPHLEGE